MSYFPAILFISEQNIYLKLSQKYTDVFILQSHSLPPPYISNLFINN